MKAWCRYLPQSVLLPAAALLLAACSVIPDSIANVTMSGCNTVNEKALKYVNWTRVPEVNVHIRHDEIFPMVIRLRQGWPYVFRIRNRDDRGHLFQANKFFRKAAVIQVSIADKIEEERCFSQLMIPPRQTAVLRLVASVDGYYEYAGAHILNPFAITPMGVILIEERAPRI